MTALEFRDALRHLIALEKKMRLEMQTNLRELKLHMTQRRVDRVANKAQKLFQIRQQARLSIPEIAYKAMFLELCHTQKWSWKKRNMCSDYRII